jgi:hypothetical protein
MQDENRWTCDLCGGQNGRFELATCLDAPKEGIPVHVDCLNAWFKRIDQSPFWRPDLNLKE